MKYFFDSAAAMLANEDFLRYYLTISHGTGFMNPEGLHAGAYQAREGLAKAARQLSRALTGTEDFRVHWCASGTDAIRLTCEVLAAVVPPKSVVLTTAAEHPSLSRNLERLFGHERILHIPMLHDGALDQTALAELLRNHPVAAVFVHHVNPETGRIQDIQAIRTAIQAESPKTLLLADTIQSAAKLPLEHLPVDALVVSAHKIGAPAYAALLYRDAGWNAHFAKFRKTYLCGRPEVPSAHTLVHAVETFVSQQNEWLPRLRQLKQRLLNNLQSLIPDVIFPVGIDDASPWILSVIFPKHQGAVIVRMLSQEGIYVGAGSACQAESKTPSASLTALGYSPDTAYGLLRFSFSPDTSIEAVDALAEALKKVIKGY